MSKLLILDLDDTLSACEVFYRQAEQEFFAFLSAKGAPSELIETARRKLLNVQTENIRRVGFGATLSERSFLELAAEIIPQVPYGEVYNGVREISDRLRDHPMQIFADVPAFFQRVAAEFPGVPVIIVSKGEYHHQTEKFEALTDYLLSQGLNVSECHAVSDKSIEFYKGIFAQHGRQGSDVISIGNTWKSDVAPILQLGGKAILLTRAESATHAWAYENDPSVKAIITETNFAQVSDLMEAANVLHKFMPARVSGLHRKLG